MKIVKFYVSNYIFNIKYSKFNKKFFVEKSYFFYLENFMFTVRIIDKSYLTSRYFLSQIERINKNYLKDLQKPYILLIFIRKII